MLYKKNQTNKLDMELFRNPTAEYRGTPFWAWNCKLEKEELLRQQEILKKMGFGGGHMHVRTAMATPYLSEEYMELIKACVEKAKEENMLAWLYDEDRWPSGAAGGIVTKEEKYRERNLLFTSKPYGTPGCKKRGKGANGKGCRTECGRLLTCYDIELDDRGYLVSSRMVGEDEPVQYERWYAYLEQKTQDPWFNNQTYVNTLDKEAIDRFIEVTHEGYCRAIGEEFDGTVPAIFTDEPQLARKGALNYPEEKADVFLSWTEDLPETFAEKYPGEDLLSGLPELVWERADGQVSVLRYHYHDHVCDRFTEAFTDNVGRWCREHHLAFTGHMMDEHSLRAQTAAAGEMMRCYRGFDLPGIDMLAAHFEFITAKQAQSAVHQYGREGMMSELYGVTNWDFDFRGHKLHGDWQAALGVTVRVPHLAWVSMAGEAKRDYPASINYQSPWWEKYSLVEDHFARVNTALTRGTPVVRVGVIHPVESIWIHFGPDSQNGPACDNLEDQFSNITRWLLFGGIDFDYISESLLPELCESPGAPLRVGAMAYDMILVPGCETLRSTTLDCLEAFAAAGGKLVFVGNVPTLADALPSERGRKLAERTALIPASRSAVLQAAESVREVTIRDELDALTKDLVYQLRQDKTGRWLFIAHAKEPDHADFSRCQELHIRLKGKWNVTLFDTQKGTTENLEYHINGDRTDIIYGLYDYDSLLLWLEPAEEMGERGNNDTISSGAEVNTKSVLQTVSEFPTVLAQPLTVPYTLSEPNVVLLDQAEYALDEGEWQPCEELLRLDDVCRAHLGWPRRNANVAQPWVIEEEPITHYVRLRFRIQSQVEWKDLQLAMEDAECIELNWNGEQLESNVVGWYVDKSIKTVMLPPLKKGENILEAKIPFGKRTNIEWAYLLGDFGVEVHGRKVCITMPRQEIAFGSIGSQGLPFYTGNITYHIPVETSGGKVRIRSNMYRGVLQTVRLDEAAEKPIIYPPFMADLGEVSAGKHTVHLTLYGHRRNGFGNVHAVDQTQRGVGPGGWRSEGEGWTYDYMLCDVGVMVTPQITEETL